MRTLIFIFTLLASTAWADKSLQRELNELDVQDAVPSSQVSERLYAVQMRAHPLGRKWEVLLGGNRAIAGSEFLITSQVSFEGQYHYDDRWAVAAAYSRVFNEFTQAADNLQNETGKLPDVDYATSRIEARGVFNAFYGKVRFSRNQAVTFDQYFGLGLVRSDQRLGASVGAVGDFGFAFWLGRSASVHLGLKDYYYEEKGLISKGMNHNVHAYAQAGALF